MTRDRALLAARILLGAALLWAGASKLGSGHATAESLANYKLLPAAVNQMLAVTLPWWEIAAGVLLAFGLWVRAAGLLSSALFSAFGIAVASALARGLDIECGCFGSARAGLATLAIDALGLAVSAWISAPLPAPPP